MQLEVLQHAPGKPRKGDPCNGCGFCCAAELCKIAIHFHGDIPGPCPEMVFKDGRFWCGMLLRTTDETTKLFIRLHLGIGYGCCSDDPD